MKVLVACEFSGRVRDAFIKLGHDAMSCDLLPTESPGPHYQGDVRDILQDGWDLMIAHPPCTHLAVSGARWFKHKQQEQAAAQEIDMTDKTEPLSTVAVDPLVSAFSENDCLACGPFEGDFGSPDDRILKDKMVTARKGGECFLCEQEIRPGERIRTMAAVFDGELMSYRWCNECCAAMAKSWLDDGDAYEQRAALAR